MTTGCLFAMVAAVDRRRQPRVSTTRSVGRATVCQMRPISRRGSQSVRITVRLDPEDLERLNLVTKREGVDRSVFVRSIVLTAIGRDAASSTQSDELVTPEEVTAQAS